MNCKSQQELLRAHLLELVFSDKSQFLKWSTRPSPACRVQCGIGIGRLGLPRNARIMPIIALPLLQPAGPFVQPASAASYRVPILPVPSYLVKQEFHIKSGSDRNLLLYLSRPQFSAERLDNLQYFGPRCQTPAIRYDGVGTNPIMFADRAAAQVGKLRREFHGDRLDTPDARPCAENQAQRCRNRANRLVNLFQRYRPPRQGEVFVLPAAAPALFNSLFGPLDERRSADRVAAGGYCFQQRSVVLRQARLDVRPIVPPRRSQVATILLAQHN